MKKNNPIYIDNVNKKNNISREKDREQKFISSASLLLLAKLTSMGVNFLSVPLAYNYLGSERYGLWVVINSLIAIFGFADLGVGNGVVNQVAEANGRDDVPAIRKACSAGTFVVGSIAILVLLAFLAVYPWVSWAAVFNVKGAVAAMEVGPALVALVSIFAIGMPLSIVSKVQAGLQEGYRSAAWQCLGSVMSLVALLLVVRAQLGLPWLVLALAGAPALVNGLNWGHFFLKRRRDLLPRWDLFERDSAKAVMQVGLAFFALQLVLAMTSAADSLVITKVLGPEAVAAFAIPDRLFTQVSAILHLLMGPLWPAYGEALARGDRHWVSKTLRRSLLVAGICSSLAVASLALVAPKILSFWISKDFSFPISLLAALSVWKVLESIGGALAAFLNGAGLIRLQVVCALATGVVSLGLKIWALPQWGVVAMPWVMSISFVALSLVPCAILLPKLKILRENTAEYK